MKKYFEEIDDTRQQWKIKYQLEEVIVITIIAVTAGAEHWNEITMYCKEKVEILREKYGLILENETPTDDTFQRIFAIIKPEQLEKCFRNRVTSTSVYLIFHCCLVSSIPSKYFVIIDLLFPF